MHLRLQKLNCGLFSSTTLWELLLTLIEAAQTDQSERRPHAADNKMFRHGKKEWKKITSNSIRSPLQIRNYRSAV